MMRTDLRRRTLVPLLTVVAECGYDSTAPEHENPPSPSPNDGLWTSSAVAPAILRLAPSQLLAGGTLAAATSVTTFSADLFQANSIAFDTDGTMWILSQEDAVLLAFAPAVLSTSGFKTASVVITSSGRSLSAPTALAFDGQHRLWVANAGNGTIVRFDPAQLTSKGAPVPAVVLSGSGRPTGLAFDAAGSLWVSDGQAHRVVKYGAAQLAASGAPTPDVVLSSFERSLASPSGLAFDAAGNLWVANLGRQTVVAFSLSQQAASGSSAPHIVLSPTASGATIPVGLAFDGEGSLWVISGEGSIIKYDRTVLGESGTPRPSVELTVGGHTLFWSAAFWPRPAGLPLN
jgi:sugar lactone lactonase YvrE